MNDESKNIYLTNIRELTTYLIDLKKKNYQNKVDKNNLKIKENGCHLMEKLTSLKCPNIQDVRGVGLMIGVEFDIEVKDVIQKCLDRGLLIIGAGKNVLRFVPPLIISKYEIDKGISILEEVLSAL